MASVLASRRFSYTLTVMWCRLAITECGSRRPCRTDTGWFVVTSFPFMLTSTEFQGGVRHSVTCVRNSHEETANAVKVTKNFILWARSQKWCNFGSVYLFRNLLIWSSHFSYSLFWDINKSKNNLLITEYGF